MESYKIMQGIPCGYRFLPSDEELVSEYLLKKVNGEALPSNVITDCEIYGDREPWKIFGNLTSQKFYVFTKLKKGKGIGNRMERKAGCGTWKIQKTDPVIDSQKNHVGFRKLFIFVAIKSSSIPNSEVVNNGHWIMHEYSLLNNESDYVVCDIRNKHGINVDEEDEPQKKKRKCKNSMKDAQSSFRQGVITVSTLESDETLSFAAAGNESLGFAAAAIPISTLESDESLGFAAAAAIPESTLELDTLGFDEMDISFLEDLSWDELFQLSESL